MTVSECVQNRWILRLKWVVFKQGWCQGFLVGVMRVRSGEGLKHPSPVWSPRKFLMYSIQICTFWCILTATKRLVLAYDFCEGVPKNLLSVLCKSHGGDRGKWGGQTLHGLASGFIASPRLLSKRHRFGGGIAGIGGIWWWSRDTDRARGSSSTSTFLWGGQWGAGVSKGRPVTRQTKFCSHMSKI